MIRARLLVVLLSLLLQLLPASAVPGVNRHTAARGTPQLVAATAVGWAPATTQVPSVSAPSLVVCGIDRSGSAFLLVQAGLRVCAEEIAVASPGDEIVVRWVASASYSSTATVLRVRIPASPGRCPNAFDLRCRRASQAAARAAAKARRDAIRQLLSTRPTPSAATDLAGFFQAASELLAAAPSGARRKLVVASDLFDTIGQAASPTLQGVSVRIAVLQSSNNLRRALVARRAWTQFLTAHGASTVTIETADPGASR